MMELQNAWKTAASHITRQMGQNRWGLVSSVRTTDAGYMVKVTLQPEGTETAWLPVLSQMVGPGWGVVCPPEVGMQAFIAPDTGDGHHNVVIGLSYSTKAMPPVPNSDFNQTKGTPVGPGEIALVSKTGAIVRLCADGSIYIKSDNVKIEGNLTVNGPSVTTTGNSTIGTGASGVFSARGGQTVMVQDGIITNIY